MGLGSPTIYAAFDFAPEAPVLLLGGVGRPPGLAYTCFYLLDLIELRFELEREGFKRLWFGVPMCFVSLLVDSCCFRRLHSAFTR